MSENETDCSLAGLCRAARQLIQGDRDLAGDAMAPGMALPAPVVAPRAVAAQPAPRPVPQSAGPASVPPSPSAAIPPLGSGPKAEQLAAIDANEVRGCVKCRLSQSRTQTVFGEGSPDAQVMFIGEGPGSDEDRLGRPFVGRAGELLNKMIAAMGLRREDVFIANVVKCRPPDNRTPYPDEAAACWGYLYRQILIVAPKVIVAMGNPANHLLLKTTVGITKLHGQWQKLPYDEPVLAAIKVMPIYHPAYVLRQYTAANRAAVWSDLQQVMVELGLPGAKKPMTND
jgi:DNA polymerase